VAEYGHVDEFFMNNRIDKKESDEHALELALLLSRLLRSALSRACHSNIRVRPMLSSPNACLIIARVSIAISYKICTKFDAVPF
jgi:hypothetical protein